MKKTLLRIFPGALTWSILILPIVLSFFIPVWVACFIIIFVELWFLKSMRFTAHLVYAWHTKKKYVKVNWSEVLEQLDKKEFSKIHENKYLTKSIKSAVKKASEEDYLFSSKEIYHVIVMATYKEDVSILRQSIESIKNSNYDLKKIIFVLACEERDKERALKNSEILEKEFASIFHSFHSYMHPMDTPGEVAGKGSNITYAGKKLVEFIKSNKIDPSRVVVTSLDADNRVHEEYFSNLSFHYIITPNRKKRSYQPLPLFYNNIWDVPIITRVVAVSSSFWHMIASSNPHYLLRNFSSHAQSLDALIEMDFWSTETIVEDGHQFWRAYFKYDGDHYVVPLYMPIYQDAVQGPSYVKTIVNQYKQLRRWAWGASDIPFVLEEAIKKRKKIPLHRNLETILPMIDGHIMWSTTAIVLTMSAYVPFFLNPEFQQTVLAYNLAGILSIFFTIALIGIFVSIWVSFLMLPRPPKTFWKRAMIPVMWFLLPITTIIFGSLPAIDAQTRLMIGQDLNFNVTAKHRKSS